MLRRTRNVLFTNKLSFLNFQQLFYLSSNRSPIKLTLYTKNNCPLCDTAKEFIEENFPNRFLIEEVDITKDKQLFRKFKLDIPVFFHGSNFLMQHKADKSALESLIRQHENENNNVK